MRIRQLRIATPFAPLQSQSIPNNQYQYSALDRIELTQSQSYAGIVMQQTLVFSTMEPMVLSTQSPRLLLLLMSCLIMAYGTGSAGAQSSQPNFVANQLTFLASCPPGHRIAFQLGQVTLHVDPRWLDNITVQSLARRYRNQCPAESVQVEPRRGLASMLEFNRSVVAAAQIAPPDLGRNYFYSLSRPFRRARAPRRPPLLKRRPSCPLWRT